jgi:hypothetical protein
MEESDVSVSGTKEREGGRTGDSSGKVSDVEMGSPIQAKCEKKRDSHVSNGRAS